MGDHIETNHLRVFTAVYKYRSFTKAAEKLYTSQPTVSEHIHNLEARLGCTLFDRLGRTILPTPEADLLYERGVAILDDLEQLEEDLSIARNSVSGELIIGASTIPGVYLLPKIAASFRETFPDISFQIPIDQSAKIGHDVALNKYFLGVVGAKIANPKLTYQTFVEDKLILAAHPKSSFTQEISLAQLNSLPFIMREEGSGTRKSMEALLIKQGFNPKTLSICATLGSSEAVKEAIKSNLGVSIISIHAVQEELENGQLKEIAIDNINMKRLFYIVTPTRRTLPYKYQELLKKLINSSITL